VEARRRADAMRALGLRLAPVAAYTRLT